MKHPPTIDHDDTDLADKRAGWPSGFVMVALIWAANLYFYPLDWRSAGLGALTGLLFAAWAIDVTGGKVPKSWRTKSTRPKS